MMAKTRAPAVGRTEGFTLVEVVVSVMLLSTVLLGLAGTASMGGRELRRSREASLATIVGRERIEEIMSAPFNDAATGSSTETVDIGKSHFVVTVAVAEREGTDGLKDVVVSVSNPSGRELQRFVVSIQKKWVKSESAS